jgi:hypothetical protein
MMNKEIEMRETIISDMESGEVDPQLVAECALQLMGELDMINLMDLVAEAVDGEYDGQPDEAQEWYDFDPDC